jgi:cytoskeletal protein RodZ
LQASSDEADAIFRDIGESLRKQREILGLALDEVERNTHLRMHYLKSLEAGDLNSLPSPVQGRGMLHNYAEFLGMDADALLLRFAEGLQVRLAARQATRPSPRVAKARQQQKKRPSLRRIFSVDFIIGGAVVGLLTGFIVWGVIRISDIRTLAASLTSTPTAPSIAEVLFSTPSLPQPLLTGTLAEGQTPGTPTELFPGETPQEITGTPGELSEATAEVSLPPIEDAAIQVQVVVRQRAWMRVMVDGEVMFPGSAHSFAGDDRVEVLTGNGAALQLFYNQTDLGTLGGMGEVVFFVFTLEGVQTPTPTITPSPRPVTPSPTPRVTSTTQP